jgi:hypothetical protein
MMQKQFKQWMLLAALVPAFASAQSLQSQATTPAADAATAAPDPAKQAAIKDLLDAIDAQKLVGAIGNSAQMQSKQLVPAILSDALSENKTMNDKQKQACRSSAPEGHGTEAGGLRWSGLRDRLVPSRCYAGSVRRVREVLHDG